MRLSQRNGAKTMVDLWLKNYEDIDKQITLLFDVITSKVSKLKLSHHDIVILALTKRITSNYSAIHLLLKSNYSIEALMIIRAVIESIFVFNGLIEKPKETYELLEKLSNYNKSNLHSKALKNMTLKERASLYDFSKLKKSKVSIKQFNELSSKNDDLYDIAYSYISNEVHINLLSIESFLVKIDDNSYSLKKNFDMKDMEVPYFTFVYCTYLVLEGLNARFALNLDDDISFIYRKLLALQRNTI